MENVLLEKKEKKKNKNLQIQALRAVFCLMIVFFHFTYRYSEIYQTKSIFTDVPIVSLLSHVGIASFFVITGYYLIRMGDDANIKNKMFYWIKRFLNIYIPYVLALVIIFCFSFTELFGETRSPSFFDFVQNIFFINIITGAKYVDGAHWYVFSLICLFIISFIYDLLPISKRIKPIFWMVILLASIISILIKKYVETDLFICKIASFINYFLCNGYFLYAFIGIALRVFDYNNLKNKMNVALIIVLLLILCFVAFDNWIYLLCTIVTSVLFVLAIFERLVFLEKLKPIILIGNCSYSIYLLHQNIGYGFLNLFTNHFNYYIALVIVILIVLLIGIAYGLLVEQNIKKIIAKL